MWTGGRDVGRSGAWGARTGGGDGTTVGVGVGGMEGRFSGSAGGSGGAVGGGGALLMMKHSDFT